MNELFVITYGYTGGHARLYRVAEVRAKTYLAYEWSDAYCGDLGAFTTHKSTVSFDKVLARCYTLESALALKAKAKADWKAHEERVTAAARAYRDAQEQQRLAWVAAFKQTDDPARGPVTEGSPQ